MATNIQNMETRIAAIYTELAALSASTAGGLPNASGSDTIDHVGYKDGLYRELEQLEARLMSATGAFEVTSEARG